MTRSHHQHVPHGILPPYLLENIARNGSRAQQERARRALVVDSTLRDSRVVEGSAGAGRPPRITQDTVKQRHIYDAKQLTDLPGELVRDEGAGPSSDVAVDEAYDYMGATWDFYATVFGRNSWDNAGGDLIGSVHYDRDYNNAFWDGSQMVYGDGDGEIFNRFTISVDVIGHELTHGVTQAESGLVYEGQSGALNESISDVFGSMVKQHLNSETVEAADWLIGEGLFTAAVNGVALRSMATPGTAYDDPVLGKDPQPGSMDGYVDTTDDNGGVHINSGIPNHAFYLYATALGGFAWEKAGRVWFETCIDDQLPADVTFQGFADLTVVHAEALFGQAERTALVEAWSQVGITTGAGSDGGTGGDSGDGGSQDGFVARIAVLHINGELMIQQGSLGSSWTLAASEVQTFALDGNRIAILDRSGRLLVREGGPEATWTSVATDVQAFAMDTVSSIASPSHTR